MLVSLKDFKKEGKGGAKKVKEMLINGKNIYSNIKGHENEINYELYDLPLKKAGFENLVVSLTILYPGKVGREFKMTTGHKHDKEKFIFSLMAMAYCFLIKKSLK
jgi:oxalate decarboxylase/phosphoglucose isomerase-like protein (cupin superfamily)